MLAGQKKNLLAVAKNWYHQFSIHTLSLIQGNKSVCGFHLGYLDGEMELITEAMNTILDLYKAGKVKPRIDSTWHLEQVCVFTPEAVSTVCIYLDIPITPEIMASTSSRGSFMEEFKLMQGL